VSATLLLLADGRFPSGAHAHSAGVEAACDTGAVHDVPSLSSFVEGRLVTTGLVEATFAAHAAALRHPWLLLDAELDQRLLSPRTRSVSRTLGRQMLRAGRHVWPSPALDDLHATAPDGVHQAVVLGALASAAGLSPRDAALCSLHHLVSGLGSAALRLLGLDPFGVHALTASFARTVDEHADAACRSLDLPLDRLPAAGGPLVEILAEDHATWEVRLFAS
jgi:urease accessory protein